MFLNPEKNLFQTGVSKGSVVADFGCGAGYYTYVASRMVGEEGKVYAIDVSGDLLKKIANESKQKNISNINVVLTHLEKEKGSGLKDESVDLIILANTFYSIARKDRVVEEALRILRKKGRVLFVEWKDKIAGLGPHAKHLVDKGYALTLFKKMGFVLDREIEAGDHHYGLVFRKD